MKIGKIERQEDVDKRRRKNMLIMSIVMIAILMFSTAGYFFGSTEEDNAATESAGQVQDMGGTWAMKYGDGYLRFSNSPESVKNLSVMVLSGPEKYAGKNVYIASDNQGIAEEIAIDIQQIASRVQMACYGKCEQNYPEKDCNETMIVFNQSLENYAYENGNCVFVYGDMRAADAFLYRLFGVNTVE
jgi:hypothetical protein